MAGKKGKKGKKGKGKKNKKLKNNENEEPQYKLITAEDVMKQDIKFNNRIDAIKDTDDKFNAILKARKEFERQNEEKQEWLKYLKCDALPKAYEPTEIREFLSKWEYYDELDAKTRHSWLLNVDERSLLTQDIDAPNLTKKFLRTQRRTFSHIYRNHIERILTVLAELRDVLASSKIESPSIYKDLLELKDVILRTVQDVLDKFTYRVIRSAIAYMEQLDSQTYDYHYECEPFQLHIWGFKNVPISFTPSLIPKKEVDLHALKVHATLPFAVLHSNLVMRGLHMIYDHYSEFAKTFEIPETLLLEENFSTLLTKEWEQKKMLQQDLKDKMMKERAEYEDWIEKKKEEEAKQAADAKAKGRNKEQNVKEKGKKKKNGKGKKGKNVFMKEPPKIDENTFPDIEGDFTRIDNDQYKKYLNGISPEVFELEEGEINLREYTLLGGIYEFNFVQKPRRTLFPGLLMKWIEHPEKLKYENKNCHIRTIDLGTLGIKLSQTNMNRERAGADDEDETKENPEDDTELPKINEEFSGEIFRENEEEPALTFFIISFKIPKEICRWSTPIPCQWYEVQDVNENNTSTANIPEKEYEIKTPVIINDFVLSSSLERQTLFHIINHLVPRLTSNHQFSEDSSSKGLRTNFSKRQLGADNDHEAKTEQKNISKTFADRLFPVFQAVQPVIIVPMEEDINNLTDIRDKTLKMFSHYLLELEEIKKLKYPIFKEIESGVAVEDNNSKRESKPVLKSTPSGISKKSMKSPKKEKGKKKKKIKEIEEEHIKAKDTKGAFKRVAGILRVMNAFKENLERRRSSEEPEEQEYYEDETSSTEKTPIGPDDESFINTNIECLDSDYKHPKWSTKSIFKTEFDAEKCEVKLWTHRLGVFAFAFRRYTHLPFTNWHITPDPENWAIIKFHAESKYIKFNIDITEEGYMVEILDYKMAKGMPIVQHEVKQPLPDLRSLKRELQKYDMNIFPEKDAMVYIENATEKHRALELHTYGCMALYCTFMKFYNSKWNRVTGRRIMIMKCGYVDEETVKLQDVKITPEECIFVEITELCTDLNKVVLKYTPTWQNIKYTANLLALIKSVYYRNITNLDHEQLHRPKLQYHVMTFLQAVRPLSFSW